MHLYPRSVQQRRQTISPYILVIDDNIDILSVIKTALEDEGYAVETATNDSVQVAGPARSPCLILLDLCMPVMNGLEIGRHLQADPATAALPIIVMSAADEQVARSAAEQLGAVAYLPKPFHLAQLTALVAPFAQHADGRKLRTRAGVGPGCATYYPAGGSEQ